MKRHQPGNGYCKIDFMPKSGFALLRRNMAALINKDCPHLETKIHFQNGRNHAGKARLFRYRSPWQGDSDVSLLRNLCTNKVPKASVEGDRYVARVALVWEKGASFTKTKRPEFAIFSCSECKGNPYFFDSQALIDEASLLASEGLLERQFTFVVGLCLASGPFQFCGRSEPRRTCANRRTAGPH